MSKTVVVAVFVFLVLYACPLFAITSANSSDYLQWSKPQSSFPDFSIDWTTISPPPTPCFNTAGTYAGESFYQVCGRDPNGVAYPNVQRYNGGWSVLSATHPGGGVYSHSAAIYASDKILVSGGSVSASAYYDYVCTYRTSANDWIQGVAMPQAHMKNTAMASNIADGTCWILGGELGDTGTVLNTVYKWTPECLSMQTMTPMPAPRKNAAAVYVQGKIYVFGGAESAALGTNTIWRYDCTADTWSVLLVHLNHARTGAAAVQAFNQDIFILGGQSNATYLDSVEKWSVEGSATEDVSPMLFATTGMAAGGESWGYPKGKDEDYGGVIYVSGGYNGVVVTQANMAIIESGAVEATSLGNIKALFR